MHLSNSLPAIHDGLLLTTDLSGLVHCLDVTTGELLWTHDQLATCWSGPLLADGKAWVIDEDGDLSIFALSREKQLLAEIAMNSPGYTNLAAANQTLYVATKTQLVAIGSGEFPQPNGVTAKLHGGLEIELVGITPNAAPTSEGWRADGSLIEGAGDWPRGATFSKDGDRFTITTDGASKLSPDPLARDLLFESRGLRAHPAWVILNQKGLTQFESVNADETIRRRLSYLPKESGQPLTVEMALTDSPWGPWQRIDKSGKRINKIETFEPDQKLYEDIKFLRFGPALEGNAQRSLELVLDEPATHDDYRSGVFDITVRFIGTDQKVWTTYAQPKSRQDGRRQVVWRTGGDVPLEKIDRIEFRLRPYRHFITFKNVPLDRTPGAQVAVEHRSLPLPPQHAPDARFTAKVPGGIEIELLRIVRNDLPEDQSWTPDGMPSPGRLDWPQRSHYKVQPDGNGYSSSDEGPGSDRVWDFVYEVRSSGSKPFASVDLVSDGSVSSSQFSPAIGPRLVTVIPDDPKSLTAFQLRVGTEPWGEWIQVGADGEILNPEAIRTATDAPDRLVTHMRAGLDAENLDRSWLQWRTPQNHNQYYQMEVRAIDDDGRVTESHSSTHSVADRTHAGITRYFNLPLDRLTRFEYRLRPYRHLVRFDQICSDPAKPTEVKVSVDPIVYPGVIVAEAKPREPVAKSPTPEAQQPRIDLIGLTYDSVPKKETWNTNGQPLPAPDWVQQLPKLYGDDKGKPAPLFLFEVHGLRAKPSFRHRYRTAVVSGDDEVPEGRPYRMAVLYEDLKPEERNQFIVWGEHPAVRITDEPWGPWRTITKEGQFAEPIDPNTLYREGYDMVTLHGFRPLTKKPNDPELAPDAVRTGLVLKHPMDYDALYAIEIEAVPSTAGPQLVNVFTSRPVQRFRNEAKDRWDVESEWPVDPTKIDHLRYRIRPYRHRFEFQEVAYKQYERPATSAPFKVIHTTLEHDLPKPVGVNPTLIELQVVDAETGKPIAGAEVTVRQTISTWQPKAAQAKPNLSNGVPESRSTLRTNATGHFSFTTPPEIRDWQSDLQISIRHPDYVIEQSFGTFHVTPEMATNPELLKEKRYPNGLIKLNRGHEISGQILGPDGKPAAGVKLYAAWQMPQYLDMLPHAVTDDQGRYKFRTVKETESDLILSFRRMRWRYRSRSRRSTANTRRSSSSAGQPSRGRCWARMESRWRELWCRPTAATRSMTGFPNRWSAS
jgi:protocatechuate 3,4-dioxygenase beta subunit